MKKSEGRKICVFNLAGHYRRKRPVLIQPTLDQWNRPMWNSLWNRPMWSFWFVKDPINVFYYLIKGILPLREQGTHVFSSVPVSFHRLFSCKVFLTRFHFHLTKFSLCKSMLFTCIKLVKKSKWHSIDIYRQFHLLIFQFCRI